MSFCGFSGCVTDFTCTFLNTLFKVFFPCHINCFQNNAKMMVDASLYHLTMAFCDEIAGSKWVAMNSLLLVNFTGFSRVYRQLKFQHSTKTYDHGQNSWDYCALGAL